MRWINLIFWITLCFLVAIESGRWTAIEAPTWFHTLAQPSFAPPGWIFGPVWTLLYAMMAVAAWRIWQQEPSTLRSAALVVFLVQLALNFAWSVIFFRWHRIGGAFAEMLVLWAAIGVTTLLFVRVNPLAAWLMTPYWVWISFAAVLNGAYWRLN
jgi:tryptophan-rich sensory protein